MNFEDMRKIEKERQKERQDYLRNKKHERYKLQLIGEGFIIFDILNERELQDKRGYMLIPDRFNEPGYHTQKGFLTPEDLVDKMNELDFHVNGDMEDADMAILNKESFLELVKHKLNDTLKMGINGTEKFKVFYKDYYAEFPLNELTCTVEISDASILNLHDSNMDKFIRIIHRYIEELEDSDDPYDSAKVDALIELKMRVLERKAIENISCH